MTTSFVGLLSIEPFCYFAGSKNWQKKSDYKRKNLSCRLLQLAKNKCFSKMLVLVRVRVEQISSSVFFPTNLVILLFLLFALFLSFPNLIYFFYICSYRRTWATKNLGTFYFVLRAFHSFWESGLEINPGSEPMPLMGGEILWLCRASSWVRQPSLFCLTAHISVVCLQIGPSRNCSTIDGCS